MENWQEQPFNVTFLLLLYTSYYFICIKNAWLLINLWLYSGLDLLHFSLPLQDKVWKMHTFHTGHGITLQIWIQAFIQWRAAAVPRNGTKTRNVEFFLFSKSLHLNCERQPQRYSAGRLRCSSYDCPFFNAPAVRQSMIPKTLIRWAGNNYCFAVPCKKATPGKGQGKLPGRTA